MKVDYNSTLEKAVLEYAAHVAAHPKTSTDKYVQIPGFMDDHVWGMAMQLNDKGFLKTSKPNGGIGVGITELHATGSTRLKELAAQAQQVIDEKKAQFEEANERARKKKWWRRLGKRA